MTLHDPLGRGNLVRVLDGIFLGLAFVAGLAAAYLFLARHQFLHAAGAAALAIAAGSPYLLGLSPSPQQDGLPAPTPMLTPTSSPQGEAPSPRPTPTTTVEDIVVYEGSSTTAAGGLIVSVRSIDLEGEPLALHVLATVRAPGYPPTDIAGQPTGYSLQYHADAIYEVTVLDLNRGVTANYATFRIQRLGDYPGKTYSQASPPP
jgi:hypothetical protein